MKNTIGIAPKQKELLARTEVSPGKLLLKQASTGQWMYRGKGYDWQYGTHSREATIAQAAGRFGSYDTIVELPGAKL